jgi:precorrin-6B methylase 2
MPIVRTMVRLACLKPTDRILDLGAGDGRILIEAKKHQPQAICIGYEGSYLVWLLGKIRIFLHCKEPINFHCSNFFEADLRSADVIFTYLSMQTMKKLLPKFEAELRAGTRIITHAFRIPGLIPAETADVPMSFGGTTKAYLYVWKENKANGTSAQ